jgi:hypothetical protein
MRSIGVFLLPMLQGRVMALAQIVERVEFDAGTEEGRSHYRIPPLRRSIRPARRRPRVWAGGERGIPGVPTGTCC